MRRAALMAIAIAFAPSCANLDGFLYEPTKTDHYDLADPTIPAAQRAIVTLTTPDGVTLYGVLGLQSDSAHAATILYNHGNAENIDHYWSRVSHLWSFGFNVFIYDYRGFGRSGGEPSEGGLYTDAQTALAFLRARTDLDPKRIAYYGWSLGAAVAIDLASREHPRALATESAFASVDELVLDGSLVVPPGFVTTNHFANVDKIGSAGAPVLLMHGTADHFIQPKYASELHARASEPKTLVLFDGADHDTVPFVDPKKYDDTVKAFLTDATR